MNLGVHKNDVLHCPCDAVTSQVQAREEGDLQQQDCLFFSSQ